MESLGKQLGRDLSKTQKQVEVLKSKFFLIDVCFEKAVDSLQQLAATEAEIKLSKIFNYIRNLVCTSFVAMS